MFVSSVADDPASLQTAVDLRTDTCFCSSVANSPSRPPSLFPVPGGGGQGPQPARAHSGGLESGRSASKRQTTAVQLLKEMQAIITFTGSARHGEKAVGSYPTTPAAWQPAGIACRGCGREEVTGLIRLMALCVSVVRHAETVANVSGVIQGHSDSPFSTRGIKQLAALCERFAGAESEATGSSLKKVFSSDLGRALRTANAVSDGLSQRGLAVVVVPDARLRERYCGDHEGKTYKAVADVDRHAVGESPFQVRERVREFLLEVVSVHTLQETRQASEIVVVTHGGWIRQLLSLLAWKPSSPSSRAFPRNTGIWTIRIENLHSFTSHLQALPATQIPSSVRATFTVLRENDDAHAAAAGSSKITEFFPLEPKSKTNRPA